MAYFDLLTKPEYDFVHTIKISYNSVRPKGERIKTFGGIASGPENLKDMFVGIDRVLKNQIDKWLAPLDFDLSSGAAKVRPIHILDIGNLIGQNVVMGGVRRTAEMFLFDPDDLECLLAKYGKNGYPSRISHPMIETNIAGVVLVIRLPWPQNPV